MLRFKRFVTARRTITGVEAMNMLRKGQGGLRIRAWRKAFVIAALARIVGEGGAVIATLESGTPRATPCDRRNLPPWWETVTHILLYLPAAVQTKLNSKTMNGVRGSRRSRQRQAFLRRLQDCKIQGKAEKENGCPGPTLPGTLHDVDFIKKDSKQFPDTSGWGYAQLNYEAASCTFTLERERRQLRAACNFHSVGREVNGKRATECGVRPAAANRGRDNEDLGRGCHEQRQER